MRKGRLWLILFWLCLVGALACGAFTGWYYFSRWQSEQRYNELREQSQTQQTTEAETQEPARTYTLEEIESAEFTGILDGPEPKIPREVLTDVESHPVDFDKLADINPELYAWIRIPDTHIDYPIAQHEGEDQAYYLHHDLYGDPQFAGCIYSEEPNAKDFTDPVTVLFGHNMRNGSMFQNLYRYLDEEIFRKEDNYIYVYTPDGALVYKVYSAYYGDDFSILDHYDIIPMDGATAGETAVSGDAQMTAGDAGATADAGQAADAAQSADAGAAADAAQSADAGQAADIQAATIEASSEEDPSKKKETLSDYIDSTLHPRSMAALVDESVEVTEEDHILTLSTCVAGQTDKRLLVQAVLLYTQNGEHEE